MEVQASKKLRQYSNNKKILLVGEGDFSFSLTLAKAFGSATNMITTTSLNIRDELGPRYNNGKANVDALRRLGCTVLHGVNVHSMTSDDRLAIYDIIVFNFPHAGKHHEIVSGFMGSVREMVKDEDGQIITHNTIYPFNKWDIKTLAEEKGLRLIQQRQFNKWAFPSKCDSSFHIGSTVSFMFKK